MNWAANVIGNTNTVAAGPGPLAAAWTVLTNGQTVTKTDFGIAINGFRIGGQSAPSGQSNRTKTVDPAGTTTGIINKASKATVNPAGTTTGIINKTSKATGKPAGTTTGSNKKTSKAPGKPARTTTGSNKKTSKANDKPAGTTTGSNKDKS